MPVQVPGQPLGYSITVSGVPVRTVLTLLVRPDWLVHSVLSKNNCILVLSLSLFGGFPSGGKVTGPEDVGCMINKYGNMS